MSRQVFHGLTVGTQVLHGRPVVAGTRVPVEVVLGELAGGSAVDDVLRECHLAVEQLRAALAHAGNALADRRSPPLPPRHRRACAKVETRRAR